MASVAGTLNPWRRAISLMSRWPAEDSRRMEKRPGLRSRRSDVPPS
jgi:hypothetical protein